MTQRCYGISVSLSVSSSDVCLSNARVRVETTVCRQTFSTVW